MASKDGARPPELSVEEAFDCECSPCKFEDLKRQAMFFCSECEDYLCESCELSHKKFSSTRKHHLVSRSMLSKGGGPLKDANVSSVILCLCSKAKITLYCKTHNLGMCLDCKSLKHMDCQTYQMNEATSFFADKTLENLNKTVDMLTLLQNTRTKDLQTLSTMMTKCRESIKAFKAELIAQLDELEKQTLANLDLQELQQRNIIQKHIDACKSALVRTTSYKIPFEAVKRTGDKDLLVIKTLQLSTRINSLNELITDMKSEVKEINLKFDRNDSLKRTDTNSLGVVKGLADAKVHETITNVADMSIRSSRQINIKLPTDDKDSWISGSLFLSTGELVLCDRMNKKLKVLNKDFTPKENIALQGQPWDVSSVTDTEVVTTLRDKYILQFVQILPSLSIRNSVQLDKECRGIAVHDRLFYISFLDGEVRVMDKNGQKQKSIFHNLDPSFRFQSPLYVAVSKAGRVYISEHAIEPTIYCMMPDGNSRYSYRDSGLVYSHGIFVDDGENLFACGYMSNNVYVVNEHGKKIKVLLSQSDGLQYPNTITFRQSDKILVVGCFTNNILICEME